MVTAAQLATKGVVVYMVGCEPSIVPYKDWFMAVAHITGGQYVPLTSAQMLSSVSTVHYVWWTSSEIMSTNQFRFKTLVISLS